MDHKPQRVAVDPPSGSFYDMPSLARINVTPIKGTALQHPETAAVSEMGIAGNRRFHLIDARGRLVSGSVHGPLVQVAVAHDLEARMLDCRFPDGTSVAGRDDALGEAHETEFYGRPVPGHLSTARSTRPSPPSWGARPPRAHGSRRRRTR
jgi:hypothetical protein